ncbi:histone-like nucleoid-structuring protein Lsr2 [Cellulosimicrobium cellulans]|uniref:Lsr2 family DNA-binding protein n=1 Tax=Cellulosimicrobium cellulans TaxID=1710 RepID=UPI00165272DA|nr:histone-like nucleoid-structuring protein Lsr2 [Cellulosimicrobium cellulans]
MSDGTGTARGRPRTSPGSRRRPPLPTAAVRVLAAQVGRDAPDLAAVGDSLDELLGWWRRERELARGRRGGGTGREGSRWPAGSRPAASDVRAWARRAGLRVAGRGRIPDAVVQLYLAQHGLDGGHRLLEGCASPGTFGEDGTW